MTRNYFPESSFLLKFKLSKLEMDYRPFNMVYCPHTVSFRPLNIG